MNNMNKDIHKLIIIGAGSAGYTASIYSSRYKVNNLIIGNLPGGQITEAHKVCNFPNTFEISGMELGNQMRDHAKRLGVEEIVDSVSKLGKDGSLFIIETENSGTFKAENVLLAHGVKRRKLELKNEEKFVGRGISYCATCDAGFYRDKTVAVAGGSNAATTAALLLADIAEQVYIIYRGNKLKGEEMWIEQIKTRDNIKVVYESNIIGLLGEEKLDGVELDNTYQGSNTINLDGLFVEIGSTPNIDFIKDLDIETDGHGYIKINPDQSTNIAGLYAAGDITNGSNGFRQVITACSEGAIAAQAIYTRLQKK